MPDFEKFSLTGPSLRLRRNRQPIVCQVYALGGIHFRVHDRNNSKPGATKRHVNMAIPRKSLPPGHHEAESEP
jgi:hypothetical protein